jgi:hypothetical protein
LLLTLERLDVLADVASIVERGRISWVEGTLISEDQSGIPSEGCAEAVAARDPVKEAGRLRKDQNTRL